MAARETQPSSPPPPALLGQCQLGFPLWGPSDPPESVTWGEGVGAGVGGCSGARLGSCRALSSRGGCLGVGGWRDSLREQGEEDTGRVTLLGLPDGLK